jgi:hypothetical protein
VFVAAKGLGVSFFYEKEREEEKGFSIESLFLRKALFFAFLCSCKETLAKKARQGVMGWLRGRKTSFRRRSTSPFPLDPQHPFWENRLFFL